MGDDISSNSETNCNLLSNKHGVFLVLFEKIFPTKHSLPNIFSCVSLDFTGLIGERQAFSGINMVLHETDHPLAALDNRAITLESGTSNRLILSISEVILSQSELVSYFESFNLFNFS